MLRTSDSNESTRLERLLTSSRSSALVSVMSGTDHTGPEAVLLGRPQLALVDEQLDRHRDLPTGVGRVDDVVDQATRSRYERRGERLAVLVHELLATGFR